MQDQTTNSFTEDGHTYLKAWSIVDSFTICFNSWSSRSFFNQAEPNSHLFEIVMISSNNEDIKDDLPVDNEDQSPRDHEEKVEREEYEPSW